MENGYGTRLECDTPGYRGMLRGWPPRWEVTREPWVTSSELGVYACRRRDADRTVERTKENSVATPKVIVQIYPVLPAEDRADRERKRPLGAIVTYTTRCCMRPSTW